MVSENLQVTETVGVVSSADAFWEANVKSDVNKNSKNEKKIFPVFVHRAFLISY